MLDEHGVEKFLRALLARSEADSFGRRFEARSPSFFRNALQIAATGRRRLLSRGASIGDGGHPPVCPANRDLERAHGATDLACGPIILGLSLLASHFLAKHALAQREDAATYSGETSLFQPNAKAPQTDSQAALMRPGRRVMSPSAVVT